MNFLNFLTSKASLFNFNLVPQSQHFQKQNTILVEPTKESSSILSGEAKEQSLNSANTYEERNGNQVQDKILAQDISKLLNQEQLLINQYLELKLKYLANCLNSSQPQQQIQKEASQQAPKNSEDENEKKEEQNALRKKIKKKNKCGHDDKIHYAKGMCNNCYHKYGRTKKPWNCPHDKLYAAGMCQNCYINNYNRKKREEKQVTDKDEIENIQEHADQQ